MDSAKINMERSALLGMLGTGAAMAGRNRSVPELELVKIVLKDDRMRAVSFNGTTGVSTSAQTLSAESSAREMQFLMAPEQIIQVLKLAPDTDVVSLSLTDKSLSLSLNNGRMSLPALPADTFPQFGPEKDMSEASIDHSTLLSWTRLSKELHADDELRPVLQGMLLDLTPHGATFCVSDSRILVTDRSETPTGIRQDREIIIPPSTQAAIAKCLPSGNRIQLRIGSSSAIFSSGNTSIFSLLTAGKYPNFRSLITDVPESLTADRSVLLSALRRVSLSAEPGNRTVLLSSQTQNSLLIEAEDTRNGLSSREEIPVSGSIPDRMALNANAMIQLLGSIDGNSVDIHSQGPRKALLISSPENPNRKSLIMPLAI